MAGSRGQGAAGHRRRRSCCPARAKVGDVLKVDAEFFVDGIEITGVVPAKGPRQEPERLELLLPAEEAPLVTSSVTARPSERPGSASRRSAPRPSAAPRRRRRAVRATGARDAAIARTAPERGDRPERRDRPPRRTRPEPPPMPAVERPKAKRLRAGKAHRTALLESLPEEQRPIAEQVVLGGLPAVRQAIEKQNAERTAAGDTPIAAGPAPRAGRAAGAQGAHRRVARPCRGGAARPRGASTSATCARWCRPPTPRAKDDETRALAQALREGLVTRADAEHQAWLAELTATVDVGRIVRALRLSSRPPKAGAPLPAGARHAPRRGRRCRPHRGRRRRALGRGARRAGLLAGARQGDPGVAPQGAPRRRASRRSPAWPPGSRRSPTSSRSRPTATPPAPRSSAASPRSNPPSPSATQAQGRRARAPRPTTSPKADEPKAEEPDGRGADADEPTPAKPQEVRGLPADQAEGGSADPEPERAERADEPRRSPTPTGRGGSADPEPCGRGEPTSRAPKASD